MRVTLSDDDRRRIALFEAVAGVTVHDCLLLPDDHARENGHDGSNGDTTHSESRPRLVFLVKAGQMGKAIGPDGRTVREAEQRLGADIALVENADTKEAFVASALAPAAVYNVTISENNSTIAYAEVDPADTGVAIGKNGTNIETARRLAKRHFDIDDVQLV